MKTSQRERVLSWLRRRGQRGVHSFELVKDGMPRAAAVVHKLREEGYIIDSPRETFNGGESKGVRYILVSEPHIPAPSPAGEVVDATGLFGADAPEAKPANPYEYEAA